MNGFFKNIPCILSKESNNKHSNDTKLFQIELLLLKYEIFLIINYHETNKQRKFG